MGLCKLILIFNQSIKIETALSILVFSSMLSFKKEKVYSLVLDLTLGHSQMNELTQCFYTRLSSILFEKNAYKGTQIQYCYKGIRATGNPSHRETGFP
jgi:hypothetical protein